MNYQSIARRYLPLAAVIAVQLLIIVVVPSKAAPTAAGNVGVSSQTIQGASSGGGSNGGGFSGTGGPGSGSSGSGLGSSTGASGTGASGTGGTGTGTGTSTVGGTGTGSAGTGAGTGGTSSGAGGGSGPTANAADTTHCAGNREFSPSIDYYAPPCTPGPIGATNYANGGATYEGVNAKTITIVDYVTDYGAEINTILQAEGLYESFQQGQVLDKAWQKFINDHYVLWGRQIHLITYQGQCQSAPPDLPCLESEMNTIVTTYHPYAVFWDTTVCSACFHTLAADHVIAFGGMGFSDAFTSANAPYYYAYTESSTRMEQAFASWYCAQMQGPVKFAPANNPAQNFSGQKRVLGIISTKDDDNRNTVLNVLVPALKQGCGVSVNHFYFYDQDINTAAQQVEAGISAMDTSTNPATDVLCLCDAVAPQFLYQGEQQHNYWPENLVADVQQLTYDSSSQNYEAGSGNQSSLACPTPSVGCEFSDAIGLSMFSPQEAQNNNSGTRTYALGGGTNLPVTGITADELWQNYEMIASLIENTGPDLTPQRMAATAASMGSVGGGTTGHYGVGFPPGGGSWTQDVEVVYWDTNRKSSYNGAAGTYVPIEGTRFLPGQFPKMAEPPIPATRT